MKRIIICGAGEVGRHSADVLSEAGHHVTMIDVSSLKLKQVEESVDIRSLKGSSCHPETLKEAGAANCDLLIAATNHDEFNLLSAILGKKMGAGRVVARIHHRSFVTPDVVSYERELGIDHLICPEQLTSMAIIGNLEDPGVMAIERFAENQIEMHRYTVQKDSDAIGTRLADLKLPAEVRLAVVNRGEDYFTPAAETTLLADDIVTLIGEQKHFKTVQKWFSHTEARSNDVVLMGATSMTEWLAEDLKDRNFSIRVFESNRKKAIEFSEKFPSLTVLDADPTDPLEFREEHLEKCRVFIAATEDDEHNILGSLQAKQLGAPITAAVVHMPTYLSLIENLGVDWPFSPRIVAAKEFLKLVDDSVVRSLAVLAPRVAEAYEVGPVSGGHGVGQMLTALNLPKGAFIAAIQRGGEVHVPGASNTVEKDDILVVIGPSGMEKQLKELFVG